MCTALKKKKKQQQQKKKQPTKLQYGPEIFPEVGLPNHMVVLYLVF